MVQGHATVHIDMNQRTGLVERGPVERDAEFHRHGGEALLHHRARVVESGHALAPGFEIDRPVKLVDHRLDDVVLDRHAIGRDVVAAVTIEVAATHLFQRQPEMPRDRVDDGLDREHALRSAIAAERGIRHRIGLAGEPAEAQHRQPVAIVGMAERAR